MEDLLGGLVRQFAAAIPSVLFALVAIAIAAYAARRFRLLGGLTAQKQLDDIEDKLINRLNTTAEALREELAAEERRSKAMSADFDKCKTRLDDARAQVRSLTYEMFELYRATGQRPPASLQQRLRDDENEVNGAG